MRLRAALSVLTSCVLLGVAVTGCADTVGPSSANESKERSRSESPQAVDIALTDLCESSTRDSIQLIDAALDRMDRATTASETNEILSVLDDLIGEAGENVGRYCGFENSGAAVSELIVWVSREVNNRSANSRSWAEGFLIGICPIDLELTPAAQVACAG